MILPNLSIFIPTFNRNSEVNQRLKELIPLINGTAIRIEIVDNCSDIPVTRTLPSDIKNYVNITTNPYNVGLVGNIIKCMELCKTEWLWILSDDDIVLPNSINHILNYINSFPEAQFINFSSSILNSYVRERDVHSCGIDKFVESIDSFSNIFLLSNNLINIKKSISKINFAYLYAYTLIPHIVLQLLSLDDKSVCILSKESIVQWKDPSKDINPSTWSVIRLMIAISIVNELPLNISYFSKRSLLQKVYLIIPPPIKYLSTILKEYEFRKDRFLFYAYKQTYKRMNNHTFKVGVQFLLCKILIYALYIPVVERLVLYLNSKVRKLFLKNESLIFQKNEFQRL